MKNTAEKDRQTQILAAFALISILYSPGWKSIDQISQLMKKKNFPRCPRTIRRIMSALNKAGVKISVNRKQTPYVYRAKR